MSFELALFMLPGLVIGLTVHEFAHAWSASLLGDDFPRRLGRVSLNPFRHLTLLGTLAIFLLPFGWARPVQVNLYNFKHPRRDYLITSLAGPFANLLIVALCLLLMQFTRHSYALGARGEPFVEIAHILLMSVVMINIILGVLNLIPIPPLDGSKIWPFLIPGLSPSFGRRLMTMSLVALVVLLSTHSFDSLIQFAVSKTEALMPVSDQAKFEQVQRNATAACEAKDFARAEKLSGEALAINSGFGSDPCYSLRAALRGERGDWAGALDDIDRAVRLNPVNPAYYEVRARVFRQLGRNDEAAADDQMRQALLKVTGAASQPASRASLEGKD
jgi:Zn-dependent protease